MMLLKLIWGEMVGLFVDDELLAIAILAVVALSAVLAYGLHARGEVVGIVLLVGCVATLLASLVRGFRRR